MYRKFSTVTQNRIQMRIPFDSLTHSQLLEIIGSSEHTKAGNVANIDPIGADASESGLTLNILDGRKFRDLIRQAIVGGDFQGTEVRGDKLEQGR